MKIENRNIEHNQEAMFQIDQAQPFENAEEYYLGLSYLISPLL